MKGEEMGTPFCLMNPLWPLVFFRCGTPARGYIKVIHRAKKTTFSAKRSILRNKRLSDKGGQPHLEKTTEFPSQYAIWEDRPKKVNFIFF